MLPWLVLLVRALRIRIEADDGGVTVANVWTTRRIPWDDVASMHTGPAPWTWQANNRMLLLHVERVDGRVAAAVGTLRQSDAFDDLVAHITAFRLDSAKIARIDRDNAIVGAIAGVVRVVSRM